MTREEQINLYLKERNIPITSLEANSIMEGIKWADEHPNLYNMKLWIVRNKISAKKVLKVLSNWFG